MKDTILHLYSQLASVEIHLRPFPHHGLSRDHVIRHPRMTGGTPPPNCVTSIHNRRGDAGLLERHQEHSARRSGESDQPPARKRIIGPFWSQNLTVDLRRIYQFIWHPGIWQHNRNNYIVTTNAQNNYILFEFYPSITNESWTDMHAESTQAPTCWHWACWRDSAGGVEVSVVEHFLDAANFVHHLSIRILQC